MFDVHTFVLFICNIANELLHALVISPFSLASIGKWVVLGTNASSSISMIPLLVFVFFANILLFFINWTSSDIQECTEWLSFISIWHSGVSNTSAVSSIDSSVRSGKAGTVSFCTITRMSSSYVSGSNFQVQTVQKIQ